MAEAALAVLGLVVGAALGWLLGRAHAAGRARAAEAALAARLAAAEAREGELRRQAEQHARAEAAAREALAAEGARRAEAEARREAAEQALAAQRRLLEEAQARLADTFKALSADALRESGAAFLALARERLDAQLAERQAAVEGVVGPLREALARYEAHLRELEATRQRAWGSLEEQVRALARQSAELQRETAGLVTALRAPQVRGRWGELTLRRVVELAGLVEHCDFVEQATAEGEGGRLRPDLIVRLPGGRELVVDAKAPLAAYLDAVAARTPEERAAALDRHAQQVRRHMQALASRGYREEFARAADLVVMFIPGEAFAAAAAEVDPTLLEDGMARGVIVATPTTLVALLKAVAFGWRQEQLARNAAAVSDLGRQLYERLRTLGEHVSEVGRALARATDAYNRAVGSLEARVLPAARRFRDLGAVAGEEIPPLEPVDQRPRELTAPEFPRQLEAPELAS